MCARAHVHVFIQLIDFFLQICIDPAFIISLQKFYNHAAFSLVQCFFICIILIFGCLSHALEMTGARSLTLDRPLHK